MNQRIKELARMSGFIVDESGTFPEFAEKTRLDCFAELIIKECALVAFKKAGPKTALDVLEHFGVEE